MARRVSPPASCQSFSMTRAVHGQKLRGKRERRDSESTREPLSSTARMAPRHRRHTIRRPRPSAQRVSPPVTYHSSSTTQADHRGKLCRRREWRDSTRDPPSSRTRMAPRHRRHTSRQPKPSAQRVPPPDTCQSSSTTRPGPLMGTNCGGGSSGGGGIRQACLRV